MLTDKLTILYVFIYSSFKNKEMRQIILLLLVFVFFSCGRVVSGDASVQAEVPVVFPNQIYNEAKQWVDSVYNMLTPEERIAQLFWLAVENSEKKENRQRYLQQIKQYKPGGVLLFRMPVDSAAVVIAQMQKASGIPLLVSIDGENGLAMRFPGVVAFPSAMTLGAIQNDTLIFNLGVEIARQCKLLGIHVNMAPVADVNINPANPVIGSRSFGEDPKNVARKAVAYMQGLQNGGVMAVGKHFPGHGDTDQDSHKALPLVGHNRQRLDSVDLYPFRAMVGSGLWGMMSAHLEVPALEKIKGVPTSFSKSVLLDELRDSMQFKGLIISDAMNMQGAKIMGPPGVVDAMALAAGNDVVEFTENLPAGIAAVKRFISEGTLTWADVEDKCRRSLAFKYWLTQNQPLESIRPDSLLEILNNQEALALNQQLFDAALTVVKKDTSEINTTKNYACVVLGDVPWFQKGVTDDFKMPVYKLSTTDGAAFDRTISTLAKHDGYIIVIADSRWGRVTANASRRDQIMKLASKGRSSVIFMGNVYHLSSWSGLQNAKTLVVTYQSSEGAQNSALRFLSGAIRGTGKLSVYVKGISQEVK
jgi:beta-glucosidase-like glycosyl hydrolase